MPSLTNLLPRTRYRRQRIAFLLLGVALGMGFSLPRGSPWVLATFLALYPAWLLFLQARRGVCLILAMQGRHQTPDGIQPLGGRRAVRELKSSARRLRNQAALAAAMSTLAFYGIRWLF